MSSGVEGSANSEGEANIERRRQSPEERYLEKKRAELGDLETLLAERELELHTLRGGLMAFERQYEELVGTRYAELDELKFRIAELAPAPVENPHARKQEDAKPSAAKVPPRRRPAAAKPKSAETPKPKPAAPFNPAESLKKLYRDVAKMMHPDLADSDEARENRHRFMTRVNEAYEAGDETRVRAIAQEWEHSPESVEGVGPAADLVRAIRKIEWSEIRLVAISREIEQLQSGGMAGMKMMSEEAAQFERDLLNEMTTRLDEEIAAAKEILARLETDAPPKLAEPSTTDDTPPIAEGSC
jgi:hypothetical protein